MHVFLPFNCFLVFLFSQIHIFNLLNMYIASLPDPQINPVFALKALLQCGLLTEFFNKSILLYYTVQL